MSVKVAGLGLCFLFGAVSLAAETDALIAKLGSPRFAEREAASSALSKLGDRAIPLLRDSLQDQDPEVKSRAEFLIDSIERDMLTKAPRIVLDDQTKTLGAVVEAIAQSQGMRVRLEEGAASTQRPFRANSKEVMTFWPLMDRLSLNPVWEGDAFGGASTAGRSGGVRLVRQEGRALPRVDQGPFRITSLPALWTHDALPVDPRLIQPGIGRFRRLDREPDLVIPLKILAEPRLGLRVAGPIRILEAIDVHGRVVPASDLSSPEVVLTTGIRDRASSTAAANIRLHPQNEVGKSLKRLKGVIPMEVEARKLEPTVISLSSIAREPRAIPCGGTNILVHSVRPTADGTGGFLFEVSFRQESLKILGRVGRMPQRRLQELLPDSDPIWQNLEVVDASGQPFTIVGQESVGPLAADGEVRKLITLRSKNAGASPPNEVRFYGQIRTNLDLAFDFRDLPLP